MLALMEKLLPDEKMEIVVQNSCEFTFCPTTEVQGQQKALAVDPLLFLADNDINNDVYEEPSVPPAPTVHKSQSTASCPPPIAPAAHQTALPVYQPAPPITCPAAAPVSHQATSNVSHSSSGSNFQNSLSGACRGPLNGASGALSQAPRVPSSGSSRTLSNTSSHAQSVAHSNIPAQELPAVMSRPLPISQQHPVCWVSTI